MAPSVLQGDGRPGRGRRSVAALLGLVLAAGCTAQRQAAAPGGGEPAEAAVPMAGDGGEMMAAALAKIPEALPGAPPLGEVLRRDLAERLAAAGAAYEPRTRHLREDGSPLYTNRLFLSSSPYLQQHAHNPVNWFPWGDEAFEAARRLKRPVLLSIGYSTCHWCHVMEEESFEDPEIARVMNELYIPIKVDREVRPDVDAIYMQAVQMMSGGQGGWPLNAWLTPDREPFFGGTYFPPRDGDRGARTGFLTILQQLSRVYHEQPDKVAQAAAQLVEALQAGLGGHPPASSPPDAGVLRRAFGFYAGHFDPVDGGLNRAPKFPSSLPVRFLLRYDRRTGEDQALEMATLTLRKMATGGLYDQAGGGFHRYATDARWLVPHFEKMLYDNALLAVTYLEAWQATGDPSFARITREILRYVRRDMTSPEGAFYSATDADSRTPDGHAEEGYFFTWTPEEIQSVLDPVAARLVKAHYGVTAGGNFEGRSILHVARPLEEVAAELEVPAEEARRLLDAAREALYEARKARPAPLRDEKVLAAWNGLMIGAFARAGLALDEAADVEAAAAAARFILERMRDDRGRLNRSFKDGRAEHPAFLEDYAFLIGGLLDLYEAGSDPRWLREAVALQAILDDHYADPAGGYYTTSDDHEKLLAREKPGYDGAEPSGNSVAALNLLRLAHFTGEDRYRAAADRLLAAFGATLEGSPAALSEMLLALDFRLDDVREVVLVTPSAKASAGVLLDPLRRLFLPSRVLAVVPQGKAQAPHAALLPMVEGKIAQEGKVTAYVCKLGVCRLPTTDPSELVEQLRQVAPLPQAGP